MGVLGLAVVIGLALALQVGTWVMVLWMTVYVAVYGFMVVRGVRR